MSPASELKASHVQWERLRRMLFLGAAGVAILGGTTYVFAGNKLILHADGIVMRDRVAIAVPYEARIKQVFVRPGDYVKEGQLVASIESTTISRTVAELSAAEAQLSSRIAQLEARSKVVAAILPTAVSTASEVEKYMEQIDQAGRKGVTVQRSVQEIASLHFTAQERAVSLKAEAESLVVELNINKDALLRVVESRSNLEKLYDGGNLYAPKSGYIGSNIGTSGDILSLSKNNLTYIYTGPTYVLAYVPDDYWFDLSEGAEVAVKARGQIVNAKVEKILPVAEALPPEFQMPNRMRDRGQLMRITLNDPEKFVVEQKIQVSDCSFLGCSSSGGRSVALRGRRSVNRFAEKEGNE